MERNNESSLFRQRQSRERNDFLEGLVDPSTGQNVGDRIDQFKEYQSSGRIDNTKDARAVGDEIERLEVYSQQVENQLDQAVEEDRQRGGAGRDASTTPRGALPTFEERERDAGLFNTTPGRGLDDPTMEERERDAGLIGRDRRTTRFVPSPVPTEQDFPEETQAGGDDGELPEEKNIEDPLGTFGVILCINGNPHSASIYGQIGPKLET